MKVTVYIFLIYEWCYRLNKFHGNEILKEVDPRCCTASGCKWRDGKHTIKLLDHVIVALRTSIFHFFVSERTSHPDGPDLELPSIVVVFNSHVSELL